jgi:putative oxidoreductase
VGSLEKPAVTLVHFNISRKRASDTLSRGLTGAITIVVGLILTVAAVPKITNPYHFLLDVYRYDLVNAFWGRIVAVIIPWTELVSGSFLLGGLFVRGSLLIAATLFATFLYAQAFAIAHHVNATCACFDLNSQVTVSFLSMSRDFCILMAILIAFYLLRPRPTGD